MKSKGVEELPADSRETIAANDEFADVSGEFERLVHSESGWDPYQVWRTRVKNTEVEREADPLR